MMKTLLALLCLAAGAATASVKAETLPDGVSVINEVDTVWHFGYNGINLFGRDMHRIDIAYPSKDVHGDDVTLSGYVCIPAEVYQGEQPCDGILLYNHYTQLAKSGAPTRGYALGEDMVMANPLKPNYIVVCSDFLGFGITENRDQAFCYSDVNGLASINCLLAARQLLEQRGISQGRFIINAGYSAGGFDAIATQRVRDMKYSDQVVFHKTLVGGMPFDPATAYYEYTQKKDEDYYCPWAMPLTLDSYNRNGQLGYSYSDMFKEPLASKFEEWFISGKYSTKDIRDSLKGKRLSELIQDKFLDTKSDEYKRVQELAKANSLANGWTPDSTQRYFSMHLLHDTIVPVASSRAFIDFLNRFDYNGKKCDGYKKSIVPEKTRLQTNYFLPSKQHALVGGIVYYLTLASELTAAPVLYYDGELNTHYADFIEPATLMGIIRLLESKGFDVKGIVKKLASQSGANASAGGLFGMLAQIEKTLNGMGTSTAEVLQLLNDSGVEIQDILEVYTYLSSESSAPALITDGDVTQVAQPADIEPLLTDYYQQTLMKWLKDNNVNIFVDKE